MMQTWKKTRRTTPYGSIPKPSAEWIVSLELANCQSRSEFVERALHFYMGYLASEDITEYLSKALLTSLRGILDANDDRMRSLLFKLFVETNMMMHVIAAYFKDDIGDLRALRGYAPDDVKRTYGRISFDEPYQIEERANRKIAYAGRDELIRSILKKYPPKESLERPRSRVRRETPAREQAVEDKPESLHVPNKEDYS